MTMSGSKVEGYRMENENIKGIVVGKIVEIKRHSDADKLWVCSVFIGKGIIQIITGAQNVRVGDIVPVALDGAQLPDGQTITAGELRGLKSEGMMCSLAELGLTKNDFPECDEDGIIKLPPDSKIGADVTRILGIDDTIFEFEITPNRPDCLCISGLAREAAATFGADFDLPRPKVTKSHGHISTLLSVQNESPDTCLRYIGAVVENVRVKPSPQWLRERLRRCGVRPINNIVDITNYVMLEYNQPMHAFDYRQVKNGRIIVRRAKKGETLVTLDGVSRRLSPDMTVIASIERPVAIAGIMGGEQSGISEDTTTIIFESACFEPSGVRRASKALGMRTEASARYEKRLDPYNTEQSIIRALELVEVLDAGDVVKGVVDARGNMLPPKPIPLNPDEINRFLGTYISSAFMVSLLKKLGFAIDDAMNATPPTFRGDVESFVDLAEEIARFYGYDNIPSTVMSGVAAARPSERQRFEQRLVENCLASGMYEINTSTFMGKKDLDRLGLPEKHPLRKAVVIDNPLGEETALMRTTALPGMLDVIARNYKARIGRVKFFEIAAEFLPSPKGSLPSERRKLILGSYGYGDFYDIKGTIEILAERARIGLLNFTALTDHPTFHPGRAAAVEASGKRIAVFGEVMPTVVDAFGIHDRIYLADIDLDLLFSLRNNSVKYHPLPKFPAVTRDIALVCDSSVPSSTVERAIREGCGAMLEELRVFDVYTGDKVSSGKKSIAYSLVLRDRSKTLTDAEADNAIHRALSFLNAIGIELRS
jgi:phenylalanyl-tRNA synthetase beta chain